MNPSTARQAALLVGAACAVTLLVACGPDDLPSPVPLASPVGDAQPISRANLAHLWPLTVEAGTLMCHAGQDAVFVAGDGTAYALNNRASQHGYPTITAIQADGAHLGALRSLALTLCPP